MSDKVMSAEERVKAVWPNAWEGPNGYILRIRGFHLLGPLGVSWESAAQHPSVKAAAPQVAAIGGEGSASRWTKKPVTIEAMLLSEPQTPSQVAAWCGGKVCGEGDLSAKVWIEISTLEGVMRADYGDYIIKGIKGEFYPCKPDIFHATYGPATAPKYPPHPLLQQVFDTYETNLRAIVTVAAECKDPKTAVENMQQMANGALADGMLLHKKEEV